MKFRLNFDLFLLELLALIYCFVTKSRSYHERYLKQHDKFAIYFPLKSIFYDWKNIYTTKTNLGKTIAHKINQDKTTKKAAFQISNFKKALHEFQKNCRHLWKDKIIVANPNRRMFCGVIWLDFNEFKLNLSNIIKWCETIGKYVHETKSRRTLEHRIWL